MKTEILSFSKQRDTTSASGLKFSHEDHNKHNDWIFNLDEICISNKNQTNDHSHLVCVEHGFIVKKTHTSIKKTAHKKIDLKVQCYILLFVTYNYYI